ncbi:MAG: IS4 family transposase [Saprospiraceae bacterium]
MKQYCCAEVTAILDKVPIVKNLARKKFIVLFVLAMIKTRSVQFCEVAQALNDQVKATSNEIRIQDFFREVSLDYDQVALLLAMFLPKRGKVSLCIDRTEWDFGKCQVNILMIIVRCRHISIPLYWELLDNNSGNSNTNDRIELLKKCIRLLAGRIGLFLGDREFIGHRWLKFLKDQGIRFCVRVPRHHKITRQVDLDEHVRTVEQLLRGRKTLRLSACRVDGIWGNIYVKALKDGDLLFLFGTAKTEYLAQLYKKRWRIECFFQNVKKRGFDLESTHLKDLDKLKKLVTLVSIAYALVANVGLHQHLRHKAIAVKNHGYKENSFSRRGIDIVREGLRRVWKRNFQLFLDLVIRFLRWMQINPNNLPLPDF